MAQTLYEELPQDTLAALHRYALNTRRNGGGATEGNKYRKIKLRCAQIQYILLIITFLSLEKKQPSKVFVSLPSSTLGFG